MAPLVNITTHMEPRAPQLAVQVRPAFCALRVTGSSHSPARDAHGPDEFVWVAVATNVNISAVMLGDGLPRRGAHVHRSLVVL